MESTELKVKVKVKIEWWVFPARNSAKSVESSLPPEVAPGSWYTALHSAEFLLAWRKFKAFAY